MKVHHESVNLVLVLTHMPSEFHAARNALALREVSPRGVCPGASGGREAEGKVARQQVRLLNTGGGEWAAAFSLGSVPPEVSLIWDTGSAAALGEGLETGQVVEPSWARRVNGDPAWFWQGRWGQTLSLGEVPRQLDLREEHPFSGAGILCGDLFLQDSQRRKALSQQEGGSLFSFETWAVAEAGRCWGVPVRSLRVVTDRGDESAAGEYKKNLNPCLRELYRCLAHKIEEIS